VRVDIPFPGHVPDKLEGPGRVCIGAGSRPVVVSRSRIDTTEMPRANQSSGG